MLFSESGNLTLSKCSPFLENYLFDVDELDLLRFSFELAPLCPALLPLMEEVVVIRLLLKLVLEETGLRRLPVDPRLLAATTRFPDRGSGN
jgi:hypothetical protein